ncbi:MAG: hypothetical protein E6Y63_03300 [Haemophilus parainfluenzae]|nr:hypothetical protein [uncultured Haemophilus sp.]MDU4565469.1 hypothetical protein [Haemophilus parainfluenzae]MDU4637191.1 hypothetical protein [Haemophilus parainfluenzae]MDU5989920.1 hypothetical protein [Haemophilus parainfluenzae]
MIAQNHLGRDFSETAPKPKWVPQEKITIIIKKPADAGFFIIEINYRHK